MFILHTLCTKWHLAHHCGHQWLYFISIYKLFVHVLGIHGQLNWAVIMMHNCQLHIFNYFVWAVIIAVDNMLNNETCSIVMFIRLTRLLAGEMFTSDEQSTVQRFMQLAVNQAMSVPRSEQNEAVTADQVYFSLFCFYTVKS